MAHDKSSDNEGQFCQFHYVVMQQISISYMKKLLSTLLKQGFP